MARIRALRVSRQAALLVLGGGAAATQVPLRRAFAEAPTSTDDLAEKKPIYSDYPPLPATTIPSPDSPVSKAKVSSPTPTDRLAEQVKRARLFLYDKSLTAENGVNSLMSWAFKKEENFTNTIASLAPAPETGEQLLPGAIYVLVATLAGSIVSRNRGIFLRVTVPVAVGITAGWILIPVTMRNTADLIWEYEKKVPAISDTHLTISNFTKDAWSQTKIHAQAVSKWADQTASESRKKIEELVSKGK